LAPAHPILSASHRTPATRLVRGLGLGAALPAAAAVALATWAGIEALGAGYAIVLLHVPAAWLALLLLFAAAADSASGVLLRPGGRPSRLLPTLAPIGVAASLLALVSGLLGRRALGAWSDWDARLVCVVLLLAVYVGVLVLHAMIAEPARADRAAALPVLIGALNVPAIYLSVSWWHTLHERAGASVGRSPFAVAVMAAMTLAFCMCAAAVVLARLQSGAPKEKE
jgi:heme exporter protein C